LATRLWGKQDKFFPVDRARAMVADFPNATLHVIRDAGLFAHEEQPADVDGALLPILTADA
jgi:pimeloyl-ACP methyl ester carboxylesterase